MMKIVVSNSETLDNARVANTQTIVFIKTQTYLLNCREKYVLVVTILNVTHRFTDFGSHLLQNSDYTHPVAMMNSDAVHLMISLNETFKEKIWLMFATPCCKDSLFGENAIELNSPVTVMSKCSGYLCQYSGSMYS